MRTRFAPSPTGPLHLGHAYSALLASDIARRAGGTLVLRIEDIDRSRARPEWEAQIVSDLTWLGVIDGSGTTKQASSLFRQSDRLPAYRRGLDRLWARGLLYPCTCRRRDIEAAAAAPQEGARMIGPDGLVYPGTCRPSEPPHGSLPDGVLRLDMARALDTLGISRLSYRETGIVPAVERSRAEMIEGVGDVVVARRDMGTSYHLSVVVDDSAQNISHVIRGADLAEATPIHVLLQRLLGYDTPEYHHHRLIRDMAGKRLAKRDDARAIALFRSEGKSPDDIRAMVNLPQAS
ncbi:MAG: tRNA glutamyl-Q(34) synthetase GluQRS [Pseudomonadota bacterium]